jgi:hypothetical protein
MNTSFQSVATMSLVYNSKDVLLFKVTLDADVAEFMGETRLTYVFDSFLNAEWMCDTLQSNFDALYEHALFD